MHVHDGSVGSAENFFLMLTPEMVCKNAVKASLPA